MSKGWIWILAGALALDRATKHWAVTALAQAEGRSATFLPGLIDWRYVENTGAAFSALAGRQTFLIVATAAMVISVLGYLLFSKKLHVAQRVGLSLMAAGGLGNLIDRVFFGGVIDFIEFTFVRFAIFNVADICITTGAVIVMIWVLMGGKGDERKPVER